MRTRLLTTCLAAALAGAVPTAAPAAAACTSLYPSTPVGGHADCDDVRPGMALLVVTPDGVERDCTAGFLLTDSRKRRYLTIAGTCVYDRECLEEKLVPKPDVPQPVPAPIRDIIGDALGAAEELVCVEAGESGEEGVFGRKPPVVYDSANRRIGVVSYAVDNEGVNFGLVRLDSRVKAVPAVPHWGGPSRIDGSSGAVGAPVRLMAPLKPLGSPLHASLGVAVLGWGSRGDFAVTGPWAAPVLAGGTLVLTESGAAMGQVPQHYLGYWYVSRLADGVARSARVTRTSYRIATAPVAK